MRKILTLTFILTICFTQISFSQNELKTEKSENARLINVLNNYELILETSKNYLSVRIHKIDYATATVGFVGSEGSDNLSITVSEFDKKPN